jgi:two-component system, OmpR family, sensor histidine kinase MtrB
VRTVGGSCLGLSISLEDARLHNGWLQVWGQPGHGAQFRLTLPLAAGGELTSSPLPLRPAVVRRPLPPAASADEDLPSDALRQQVGEPVEGSRR